MFQYVNEVAVLGTTFFMMALTTLWYSEYLFQNIWLRAEKISKSDIILSTTQLQKNIAIMFCSYFVAVCVLAVVIGYAQLFEFSIKKIVALAVIGFAALESGQFIRERHSFVYYLVRVGFSTIFIVGSAFFLYHWPW